jgi:cyclomaltodextrinase / maltogenic alpha-amylase / neopullulanase
VENKFATPEWVKHAVFYQIFPDRFAFSQRVEKPSNLEDWDSEPTIFGFKGGDLLGVAERLDYLQDLGITAIYFNPIFQSASNHRYHTHDYFRVDPLLGGDAAFDELLKEAHQRGIRVVLDGVFNHASRGFFQFNHLLECGEASPYIDWFNVEEFPVNAYSPTGEDPNFDCWINLPALPKFNIQNPQVRKFIMDVARFWLEKGIDGWRLDVPSEIDDDSFWQEFRQVVKGVNPDAYIVGEIPMDATRWLKGDQFDGVMNYLFTQACVSFFGGDRMNTVLAERMMGFHEIPVYSAQDFLNRAEDLLHMYPREAVLAQLNLLDSHDMPRFVSLAGGNKDALRLAALFQMTYPGAPCIYYGDEIGMENGPARISEDARYAFHWDESRWDLDLRNYYKSLIAFRKENPVLRTGEFIPLHARDGILAYLRQMEGERLLVVINNNAASYKLDFSVGDHFSDGDHLRSVFGGGGVARVVAGRATHLALPPYSGVVFHR